MSESERTAPADGVFMRRALALAAKGWGHTAPNPMVGAVVVRDGAVVGEGWHTRFGAPHAEVDALRSAGENARGATLHVSLEPCNHHGKTPPCTQAIMAAGIVRVVCATRDSSRAAGGGAERLRDHGIAVIVGVEEVAARDLNASFFHAQTSKRPFVILKLAVSRDQGIADHTRKGAWLTGAESRREVHRLRAGVDAVAVGIGTALADDPRLTVRDYEPAPRIPPVPVVFDTSARLPLDSRLVRAARDVPVIVVCWAPDPVHAAALEHAGVSLLHAASLSDALEGLRTRGVLSLLVEGGAALAGALVEEAFVDRLIIFRAPVLLGGGALPAFSGAAKEIVDDADRWRVVATRTCGDDEMTIYAPAKPGAGAI